MRLALRTLFSFVIGWRHYYLLYPLQCYLGHCLDEVWSSNLTQTQHLIIQSVDSVQSKEKSQFVRSRGFPHEVFISFTLASIITLSFKWFVLQKLKVTGRNVTSGATFAAHAPRTLRLTSSIYFLLKLTIKCIMRAALLILLPD